MKKIYHEIDNPVSLPMSERNEFLYRLYLEIAQFNGHKIICLIAGKDIANLLAVLPGKYEIKEEQFYLLGYNGVLPIYVDASLGRDDILVVAKKGTEKIRLV